MSDTGADWSIGAEWSREEEKAFEDAIAMHWIEDNKQTWDKISCLVPSKSIQELKYHYQLLVEDVAAIDAGDIPFPTYNSATGEEQSSLVSSNVKDHYHEKEKQFSSCGFASAVTHESAPSQSGGKGRASSRAEQERRKGIPWTEEEHR